MGALRGFVPLDIGDAQWMQDYGWALLAVAGLFIVSLYLWSYLSKHFQKMKAKEGKYLDSDVIGFLDHVVKAFILIILIFSALYVASIVSEAFRENVWNHILGYLIEIIFIIAIVLIAMLIVRILRRIAKRARVKATSQETLHTSAVEFTSLFLSYVVYVIVAVVVIVVFVSMIPGADPYSALIQFASDNVAAIMSTVVIIIAVYFVVKLIEAILEDYKFRTKKFTPQTIDLFKISIRYALYLMAVLTAIFSLLTLMGLGSVGLVLVIITFVFVVLGIALSYSTVRNIVSGIAIMDVNPFEAGDRIRIGDDLECDVIDKGLVFTKVKTLEGEIVDVPNSELIESRILNYTRSGTYGISVIIEVSYEIPHGEVEKYVKEAVAHVQGVLEEPKPEVFALEIRENRIRYEVVGYAKDATLDRRIRSDIIFKVQDTFQAHGRTVLFE